MQICSQTPSTHRPIRHPRFGIGFKPHERLGMRSHICSHAPSTHRPMRHPRLGVGRMPHDNTGLLSQICSHAPFTHRPIRHPNSCKGLRPQVADCADAPGDTPIIRIETVNTAISNEIRIRSVSSGLTLLKTRARPKSSAAADQGVILHISVMKPDLSGLTQRCHALNILSLDMLSTSSNRIRS